MKVTSSNASTFMMPVVQTGSNIVLHKTCIVTIDAIGTQTDIATSIIENDAEVEMISLENLLRPIAQEIAANSKAETYPQTIVDSRKTITS